MMLISKLLFVCSAAVLFVPGTLLQAANVTAYNDQAAFLADTLGRTITDFDTVRNTCVSLPDPAGLTVNGINLNGGAARFAANGPCEPALSAFKGYVIQTRLVIRTDVPAVGVATASLPPATMAVGFETGIDSDPVVSRIQVTVVTSDNNEQTFTLTSKGTGSSASRRVEPLFAGFTSSRPITSLRFRIPDIEDSSLILDNFIVGQAAPPVVNASGGILNGASFQPKIAPNTWITIFGRLLSGTSRPWASADFSGARLPTSVEDVSVSINGRPAYVCYVSPNQVNVLTPADIAEGPATVVLSRGDLKSSSVPVQVQRVAPALFQFEPENRRYSIAVHADGSLVGKTTLFPGATTPARPGEIIMLWGTGFGPTIPDIPKGEAVTAALPLAAAPVVTVGGSAAEVLYAGLSGTGLYQINIRVPPGAPDGDLALSIQLENGRTQEGAVLTIQK